MKQTAVEWFFNEMENLRVKAEITNMDGNDFIIVKVKLLQQAKEMEKEQIIEAFIDGDVSKFNEYAEQYYLKTYKQD